MPHTIDYICNCADFNPSPATAEQDVLVIGFWEDFTGSDFTEGFNRFRGTENEFRGTRAGIEGNTLGDLTALGRRESLYRQRRWLQFINLKAKEPRGFDDR